MTFYEKAYNLIRSLNSQNFTHDSSFKKFPFRSFELIRQSAHFATCGGRLSELFSPAPTIGRSLICLF